MMERIEALYLRRNSFVRKSNFNQSRHFCSSQNGYSCWHTENNVVSPIPQTIVWCQTSWMRFAGLTAPAFAPMNRGLRQGMTTNVFSRKLTCAKYKATCALYNCDHECKSSNSISYLLPVY